MNCIVNVTPSWGIGQGDKLLVSVSEDLKHFRALTVGKTVICGRKTLATFPGGKPLKSRNTILLSSDEAFFAEGAEVVHSEQALFARLRQLPSKELCVIGGESVYRLLLPYCDRAYVTITYAELPADRFFPDLDHEDGWALTVQGAMRGENGLKYRFCEYRNRNPKDF
ncbi:MAG: dihydrofolate reductase [Clostridia bacterium]|nr:dihydrofolate reductase [Clostridia bacterium]